MIRVDRLKVLEYISSNPNLSALFRYYIDYCTTTHLPYHNMNHTFEMMYHIISIYEDGSCGLSDKDLYMLLISSLFHDYGHSGGLFDDEHNVAIAKKSMASAVKECFIAEDNVIEEIIGQCNSIIDATQYPYVIANEDLDICQTIIRECDILVTLSDDCLTQTIFGLRCEMHTNDFVVHLSQYLKFLLESFDMMRLDYSKRIIADNRESFLKTIEALYNIVKN